MGLLAKYFELVELTIVRRYVDMNGRYVGELYEREADAVWKMIGMSLDNLPLDAIGPRFWRLDTHKSFLRPLAWRTLRVGGTDPTNDNIVRARVRSFRWRPIVLQIENRFVEHVLEGRAR